MTTERGAQEAGRAGRPVRFTLDLARPQHRFLRRFALDAETDASVVVRTLLAMLEEDSSLAKRVLREVSAVRGRR